MRATEPLQSATTELEKIAWLSAKNPHQEFCSLMHHINVGALTSCYAKLEGRKAVGVDKITKEQYGENLKANLEELIDRMKRMRYRPGAVRQVLIPKEGKRGATRPLGISNFEDKLVQKSFQGILESIYDPIFLPCSYGFRSGIGCHDAIKDLLQHLNVTEVEAVIDVDIANYFGAIDHEILKDILRKKIKDTKFLRYTTRMHKAGVLTDGELAVSEEGVVQGSCCSPVLANIFAHYVIDAWLEDTVKPLMKGAIRNFRYADDMIICCRYEEDAKRIKEVLIKRLAKYRLRLNEDKTKLVKFSKKASQQGIKQESFDFLGFTFYLGKSQRGKTIPKLKTAGTRLRAKLKRVNEWARKVRNSQPLKTIWKVLCSKLRGHVQYYGVNFNGKHVQRFLYESEKIIFKWLNRRSQRKSFEWKEFRLFTKKNPLPVAKIYCQLFNKV
jgi:RNA-directed DNA polymerase